MSLNRWHILIASVLLPLLAIGLLLHQPTAVHSQPAPSLDEMERVIVRLKAAAPLPPPARRTTKLAQRTAVIHQLQQTAADSQAPLIAQLNSRSASGEIASYQSLWIINAVVITATPDSIAQIKARPDVASVLPDEQHRYFDPPEDTFAELLAADSAQPIPLWGIDKINAPAAWHGLGIDGSGVTVAIMDTGVDWQHPDLLPNYRGNLGGGAFQHAGSWYHTSVPTTTAPVDLHGHGTHVAGTAVGQNGIGVAPGAKWIAVSIADEHGSIYESDVHAGFQWLMAPNGDPALAPDIVNNSWGGNPYATVFLDDVLAVQAAGIIPVFAAGNSGPFPETVNSPASFTSTISVAASDHLDGIAWFSSRGPSPLTTAQNPWIAAPGTAIYSALPDNRYGTMNGTSMATPHVVGGMALLLQANPALTQAEIAAIMAQTAVPISVTHPDNASGWGRLDVYAAVATQAPSGVLRGTVRGNGQPLARASVTISMTDGVTVTFQTDAYGRYNLDLRAGIYGAEAASFGYETAVLSNIPILTDETTTRDFDLTALPAGTITGKVLDALNSNALNATITVLDTPTAAGTNWHGAYTLTLPVGSYDIIAKADGHRLGRATVTVANGGTAVVNFSLPASPSILLVDGGYWYFKSMASYYESTLAALDYPVDTWTIRNPFDSVPTLPDLSLYDTVIWSAPLDSPGYIGAGTVISDYLGAGGSLIISGQNVGSYDGYGFDTQWWWYDLLNADLMGKTVFSSTISGTNNFTGINPLLNSTGTANNQTNIDRSRPRAGSLTRPAFLYADGLSAGLQAGHCEPFRIVYTGFGLEAATDSDRAAILQHSFEYFASPRLPAGVRWEEEAIDAFALPSQQLQYTVTVHNLSETVTDTFDLSITGNAWAASLVTTTLTLGSCETGQTVINITVPADAPPDFVHEMRVIAASQNSPAAADAITVRHKIPGHILLVDDDRWYDQQSVYAAALDSMNMRYDLWDIDGNNGGHRRNSPPLEMLKQYDIVLWYTAYDWFQPITAAENEALTAYLDGGGRLFLTSQDFLYYHGNTPLAREKLGVTAYRESITPTLIYGTEGVAPLDVSPYQNNGDGLIPAANNPPFLFSNRGMGNGIRRSGDGWRSVFLSFPLEKLPVAEHTKVMNGIVGWLSDFGDTTFTIDARSGAAGVPRTYTITLRNDPSAAANQINITDTIPLSLTIQPASITGGAVYDAATRQLRWSGTIASGASHQISYQAIPIAADGTLLESDLAISYARHQLTFNQIAPLWVNSPNLSHSTLTAVSNMPAATPIVTYTLQLVNDGQQAAMGATAVITFSEVLTMVGGSLQTTMGTTAVFTDHIEWTGDLPPSAAAAVTVALERDMNLTQWALPATAVLNDQVTAVTTLYNQLEMRPFTGFFPIINR